MGLRFSFLCSLAEATLLSVRFANRLKATGVYRIGYHSNFARGDAAGHNIPTQALTDTGHGVCMLQHPGFQSPSHQSILDRITGFKFVSCDFSSSANSNFSTPIQRINRSKHFICTLV